jgi:hypothetical protein
VNALVTTTTRSACPILLGGLAAFGIGCASPPPGPVAVELIEVQRVWDRAPHQAFTDLCHHGDELVLTFREGDGHVHGAAGRIRVLASRDGRSWTSRAILEEADIDLRDPKVSVTPSGALMVLAGASRYEGERCVERAPRVALWPRGSAAPAGFEAVHLDPAIATSDDWLWRVTWIGDEGFGVVYQPDGPSPGHHLVRTRDGRSYELITTFDHPGWPNEATVRALPDGGLAILVRRDPHTAPARIGHSAPPFEEWTWADLPEHLGGPELLVLGDGRLLAAGRVYRDGAARTAIGELSLDGDFRELTVLPSGGDTSYPGAVLEGSDLLLSYYSSHEGRTSVYVARLRIER